MKKMLIVSFLTACLAGTAEAGPVLFTFDGVSTPYSSKKISEYMSASFGDGITVTGATAYPYDTTNPLNVLSSGASDQYIGDTGDGTHSFTIQFPTRIVSLSFDWARNTDPFVFEVWDTGGTAYREVFRATESGGNTSATSGTDEAFDFSPIGVTKLWFHNGGSGSRAIGIDNLSVLVPLPASVLLGVFAVGLVGRKLRKFV